MQISDGNQLSRFSESETFTALNFKYVRDNMLIL